MSDAPLMPKATAVWLVENTSLTFDQIAEFCKLHPLEVKGIADGEVATGIKGYDPISTGQLTREEIAAAEKDPNHRLHLSTVEGAHARVQEAARRALHARCRAGTTGRTPFLWLLRNHPELKDAQIMRLVGTTKHTLQAIRERTHWNSANLQPTGPGDAGPVLADRPRLRGQSRRQGAAEGRGGSQPDAGLGGDHHRPARAAPASQLEVFGVPTAEAEAGRREDRRQFGVRQAEGEVGARGRIGAGAAGPSPAGAGSSFRRLRQTPENF